MLALIQLCRGANPAAPRFRRRSSIQRRTQLRGRRELPPPVRCTMKSRSLAHRSLACRYVVYAGPLPLRRRQSLLGGERGAAVRGHNVRMAMFMRIKAVDSTAADADASLYLARPPWVLIATAVRWRPSVGRSVCPRMSYVFAS